MAPKEVSFTVAAKNAATSVIKGIEKDLGAMAKRFLSIGGAISAAFAGFSLGKLFKDSIKQAGEAERGMLRLEKAVENTGSRFASLKPQIDAVISGLERTTTFKDDELIEGLETLTLVSGDAKLAIQNIGLAADIAKAKKMSLADASTLVGKVLAGETGMLKRYGIVIDENADAIEELQKRFRGFAETDGRTTLGFLERIGRAWEEFQERLGQALLHGDKFEGLAGQIIAKLTEMEEWVIRNEAAIAEFSGALVSFASSAMKLVQDVMPFVTRVFQGFATIISHVTGELHKLTGEPLLATVQGLGKLGEKLKNTKTGVEDLDKAVRQLYQRFNEPGAGAKLFAGMSLEQLRDTRAGIGVAQQNMPADKRTRFNDMVRELNVLIELEEKRAAAAAKANAAAAGGTGGGRRPPTQEQLDAAAEGNEKLRALVEKIRTARGKELAEFEADFAEVVAKSTGSAVAGLEIVFNELIAKANELGRTADAAELTRLRDSAASTQRLLEDSARELALIEHSAKDAAEEYEGLTRLVERAEGKLRDTTLSDEDRKKLNEELLKLYEKQAKALGKVTDASNGAATASEKTKKSVAQTADSITDAARGGLELLNVLGGISDKTEEVLQNVLEMGEGIARIASGDVAGGTFQVLSSLAGLLKDTFGHPGQERARAFREQIRQAREEWELMLAPLGDELAGRSPLQQELVNLERQAEQLRRRAAADFLPQGERDPRHGMTVAELNEAAAAARRRGHHAGAAGIEAYRDALIQIEELFAAKEQQAGRRDAERQQDAAAGTADLGTGTSMAGLSGLSYVQADNLVSLTRLMQIDIRDIRDAMLGGGAGGPTTVNAGAVNINIGNIDARSAVDPAATSEAVRVGVATGVDQSLARIRRNLRAAAGAPRTT